MPSIVLVLWAKGIALQFKQAFPVNFKEYQKACRAKRLHPGQVLVVSTGFDENPRYIINFPTKEHWKENSKLEDIEHGLQSLTNHVQCLGIKSIAIPPLGCGNGGLNWHDVRPLIEQAFNKLPQVTVFLFEPGATPVATAIKTEPEKSLLT
jgi:O-acetyl-ADP-ribose deacetylase (regulator of RNase III)